MRVAYAMEPLLRRHLRNPRSLTTRQVNKLLLYISQFYELEEAIERLRRK
jgi:hypothetical protein